MFATMAKDTEESDSEKEESGWGRYSSTSYVLTAIGEIQCHLILSRLLLLRPTGTWGEYSKKNTKKVLGCHILLDMKGTYASDIRHKNKFLPHLELKKHISRMVANENKFPLSTL